LPHGSPLSRGWQQEEWTLCSDFGICADTDTRIGGAHFLATQYRHTNGTKPQFPNGIVSSVSFVSAANAAKSLAGFVWPALAP
jgi:hypothetical protein